MRATLLAGLVMAFAAGFCLIPAARAQVGDCPEDTCVKSETSLVYNPQAHTMDAFTTATTDYNTAYWYDLCVNLAVVRLNGPRLIDETIVLPSSTPSVCESGAVELDEDGSVAATPGRQYTAIGLVELNVYYTYSDIIYECEPYCQGYWYDAEGFSLISTTPNPPGVNWPSIVYSYPSFPYLPEPVYGQSLAMTSSIATAWAPPLIYSVTPNQWPAGQTTTFTISGAGFGSGPTLSISGSGVTGYANPCSSSPSSSCDSAIVATVTIDASTPGNSQEEITVTAGGQNPSGFLPVDTGEQGQATAQATTSAFSPPVPLIKFNGTDITNNTPPSCPGNGNVACVVVGQQIALTAAVPNLPAGITVKSYSWLQPPGTVVGGYIASTAKGCVVPFPNTQGGGCQEPQACQSLTGSCVTFYWVDRGNPRQVEVSYTLSDTQGKTIPGNSAKATFSVDGPTGQDSTTKPPMGTVNLQAPPNIASDTSPALLLGGAAANLGIKFTISASQPSGDAGTFLFAQLVTKSLVKQRLASGEKDCSFGTGLDKSFPYGMDPSDPNSTNDNPGVALQPSGGGSPRAEVGFSFAASMYLMWQPAPASSCTSGTACTIPVSFGLWNWSWSGDAINTLNPNQGTQGWVLAGTDCSAPQTTTFQPSAQQPIWTTSTHPNVCQ